MLSLLGLLTMMAVQIPANAAVETAALDIKRLSLEQLMDIQVYSAARRLESWQGTPSAIYVLTSDDIRRAHVTSIPEALRLVPGVQVARVDANKWAVSIRGFNARAANKLLVMIDGRSIYDPLFTGVLWESRDVMLEDVDRIEVIRGPGGTLWGANAVNGVINIITKRTSDTQGGLVTAGFGNEERAFGGARYGWQTGAQHHARVYAKSHKRDTGFSTVVDPHDEADFSKTGFRWDMDSGTDRVILAGELYGGTADSFAPANPVFGTPAITQSVEHRGGNLIAGWTHRLSSTDSLRLRFYYDRIELDDVQLGEKRDTYDVEFQHSLLLTPRHQVVWGLGYRDTRDNIRNGPVIALSPTRKADQTTNAYVQDTITLAPERLQLTLGTKLENNDYTGDEWQPNIRLAWTPTPQQTWWTAASRAVRVPSRLERDAVISGNQIGENVDSEHLDAYEVGHRRLLTANAWLDVATFYNRYKRLVTDELAAPQDIELENRMNGHTYGIELAGRWQAAPHWRLDASYTYLKMNLEVDPSSAATGTPDATERSNPHYYYTIRSLFDITAGLQFDATLRVMDDLPQLGVSSHTELDLGLIWFAKRNLELSVVGQNLLDNHHPEQSTSSGAGTEVERGVYAKATWRH